LVYKGSDIQGGNNPFDPFLNTESAEDLDRAYLLLTGFEAKPKGNLNWKNLGFDKPPKKTKGDKGGIEITFSPDEVSNIFSAYSKLEKNGDLKAADGGPKDFDPKLLKENGGRIENRKYFQLNWETPVDYTDPATLFLLSDMYVSKEEQFFNNKQIDTRLLYYDYVWIDYKEAAKRGKVKTARNAYDGTLSKLDPSDPNSKSRRDPLSKDDKANGLHRSTLTDDGSQVKYDGTVSPFDASSSKAVPKDDK
jgi:hypothetical protein